MASSVSRWLSSLQPNGQVKGAAPRLCSASSGEPEQWSVGAVRKDGRPLSAQSTLESLALTPHCSSGDSLKSIFACVSPYLAGADQRATFTRLYDPRGPVVFLEPPLHGVRQYRGELSLWADASERVISQNSSNRRVHRALWASATDPKNPRPAALKFVEDGNARDGRSLKREIECHIYVYQKLPSLFQLETELRATQSSLYSFVHSPEWSVAEKMEDAWPSAELFGYHLDKKNPGQSVLLTRKLSGPDLFDVIRAEHNHSWHYHHPSSSDSGHKCRTIYSNRASKGCCYYPPNYEYHKLRWCALALKRISQYAALSIRHNDIKPDNIVLDFYSSNECPSQKKLDVKIIDLGTASMHNAKDFTGGTSWYESPEQKLLEFYMKKRKDPDAARRVDIDLPSDSWGAGISLAEVLMGRRVVDVMKHPNGPGCLDYIGFDCYHSKRAQGRISSSDGVSELDSRQGGGHIGNYPYWAVDPSDWVLSARKALGVERAAGTSLSAEAARWLFMRLVRVCPEQRTAVNIAMARLERYAEEAFRRYRQTANSFDEDIRQTTATSTKHVRCREEAAILEPPLTVLQKGKKHGTPLYNTPSQHTNQRWK